MRTLGPWVLAAGLLLCSVWQNGAFSLVAVLWTAACLFYTAVPNWKQAGAGSSYKQSSSQSQVDGSMNAQGLVCALLDMLQAGAIPESKELDLLRGMLIESHRFPPALRELLNEGSFEPVVMDSILFTLQQRHPASVGGHDYTSSSSTVPTKDEGAAEARSYEHILTDLASSRSIFDGLPSKRSYSSFKRRSLCQNASFVLPERQLQGDTQAAQPSASTSSDALTSASGIAGQPSESISTNAGIQYIPWTAHTLDTFKRRSSAFDPVQHAHKAEDWPSKASVSRDQPEGVWLAGTTTDSTANRSNLSVEDFPIARARRRSTPSNLSARFSIQRATTSHSLGSDNEESQQEEQQDDLPGLPSRSQVAASSLPPQKPSAPPPPLMEEVDCFLALAEKNFYFDVFALEERTSGHALSVLAFFLLNRTGMVSTFRLSLPQVARFLRKIEAGYNKSVPYHNATHAADVLQTLHVICSMGGLAQAVADPLCILGAYLAAVIHDFEHQGLTNGFLIATESPLALRYNDTAPLEQHHLSSAFNVLREHNFMPSLPKPDYIRLRKVMIDLVLATDMTKHMDLTSRMSAMAAMVSSGTVSTTRSGPLPCYIVPSSPKQHPPELLNLERRGSAPSTIISGQRHGDPDEAFNMKLDNQGQLTFDDESHKSLCLQVALKCADLGHMAESLNMHLSWVRLLEEEFFQQGDREKALDLPVSPLCDRSHPGITKSQDGFINFIVKPLFEAFVTVLPGAQPLMLGIEANGRYWREQDA